MHRISAFLIFASVFTLSAIAPTSASAAHLAKSMEREPDLVREADHTIAVVEMCLVLAPFADLPQVYRPIGDQTVSLIYYPNFGSTPVIKLEQVQGRLTVTLWNDVGKKLTNNISACLT